MNDNFRNEFDVAQSFLLGSWKALTDAIPLPRSEIIERIEHLNGSDKSSSYYGQGYYAGLQMALGAVLEEDAINLSDNFRGTLRFLAWRAEGRRKAFEFFTHTAYDITQLHQEIAIVEDWVFVQPATEPAHRITASPGVYQSGYLKGLHEIRFLLRRHGLLE